MATFRWRPDGLPSIERRLARGLEKNGQRGKAVAQPLTPVLTGWAKNSEHVVVMNSVGGVVGGDTTDGNGETPPTYPATGHPTVILGSNTFANPNKYTDPEGYFLGLEMGLLSRKGSNMFGRAMAAMIANLEDDLRSGW